MQSLPLEQVGSGYCGTGVTVVMDACYDCLGRGQATVPPVGEVGTLMVHCLPLLPFDSSYWYGFLLEMGYEWGGNCTD